MKYIYYSILLVFLLGACSDYDDTPIKDKIDDFKQRIEMLQEKVSALNRDIDNLSYLTNGNVITSVTKNSDGKYVITYLDLVQSGESRGGGHQEDVIEAPILGVRLSTDDNLYYWTVTVDDETTWLEDADGGKVPVYGHTPRSALMPTGTGLWMVQC